MGKRIYLNEKWQFCEIFEPEMITMEYDDSNMQKVRIPHTCKELPYHYFDEEIYQMVSAYRRHIEVPADWMGKRVLLTFEGVAHACEIFLNGKRIGEHSCGYTAFTLDLSENLIYGEENILTVKVDSRESINVPPFGFVIDYMTYGGIYRDVYLEVKNPVYIEDISFHSQIEMTAGNVEKKVYPALLVSELAISRIVDDMQVVQSIRKKGEDNFKPLNVYTPESGEKEVQIISSIDGIELWGIETPSLYEIKTELIQNKVVFDENITVFGFRKAEFKIDGFYLNDTKIKIRGLNRHQSYPYVGYAMPKSMQCMDADILKRELGVNAVRTSHYPQSHYFLNRCDELGLLVFTEMPGWQHIGDEKWKAQAVENVREMVTQYRNHPSIILWGVRINESKDDEAFYAKTNALARELDPYRQTGGVRTFKKGIFQEDVYTYNDFSHDGKADGCMPKRKVTSDMKKPYLVTEYNGHMFPTKAFDCEEHRVEHAIRHANVLDAIAKEKDICGSFGWCMADYNTHKDFGSGDRICYHGVLDMFRNPKTAADVYASQQESTPVLAVASSMDIGEHPACNRGNTWIFTNADSVRMYKNGRFIKEYQKEKSVYKNLKHGPILIDDYIGDVLEANENLPKKQADEIRGALNAVARYGLTNISKKTYLTAIKALLMYGLTPSKIIDFYNRYVGDWGGESTVYRFEAVKDGQVVKTQTKAPMTKMHLWAEADHTALCENHTYDVAAVRIRMLDENDNLLCFYNEPVILKTSGPVELIGESVISLKGGMFGTYIKTTGEEGKAVLEIVSPSSEPVKIEFTVQIQRAEAEI